MVVSKLAFRFRTRVQTANALNQVLLTIAQKLRVHVLPLQTLEVPSQAPGLFYFRQTQLLQQHRCRKHARTSEATIVKAQMSSTAFAAST